LANATYIGNQFIKALPGKSLKNNLQPRGCQGLIIKTLLFDLRSGVLFFIDADIATAAKDHILLRVDFI
jgi:hypothetical protein